MDLKDIGFDQLLTLVKQLPDEKRATLRAALKSAATKKKSKTSFTKLLLEGPVMSDKQYKDFKAGRKKFEAWREK